MSDDWPRLPIATGENVWRLLRTDRDGATREQVLSQVGPVLFRLLSDADARSSVLYPWELVVRTAPPGGPNPYEWRIGQARPIEAIAAEQLEMPPPIAPGTVLGSRETVLPDTVPMVGGTAPWSVVLRFWWRGPASSVPYPAIAVTATQLATRTWDAPDYLLDRAVAPTSPDVDPGPESWGEAEAKRAGDVVAPILRTAAAAYVGGQVIGLAVAAGLLLWWLARKQAGK